MIYVDTSAMLKLYVDESDSERVESLLALDREWYTGRLTLVEVRRNLARILPDLGSRQRALAAFARDFERAHVIELDAATCEAAAAIAESTGSKSLDAMHLACALRSGAGRQAFLTFDRGQAQAARALGFPLPVP